MTQNNSYRSKGRALFLAALMIMSVFAVPFAFTGGAAALSDTGDGFTASPVTTAGEETTHNFNVTIESTDNILAGNGDLSSVAVDYSAFTGATANQLDSVVDENNVTVEINGVEQTLASGQSFSGASGTINLASAQTVSATDTVEVTIENAINPDVTTQNAVSITLADSGTATDNVNLNFQPTAVQVSAASPSQAAFLDDGSSQATFEFTLTNNQGNAVEGVSMGAGSLGSFGIDSSTTSNANGVATTTVSPTSTGTPGPGTYSLSFADSRTSTSVSATALIGQVAYKNANNNVRSLFYQGQDITATGLTAGEDYQLRSISEFDSSNNIVSSSFETEYTADSSGEIEIESDDLNTGDFYLRGPGVEEVRANSYEITEQSLTATFDEEEATNDGTNAVTEINVKSNRGTYALNVSAEGLDADDLEDIFTTEGDFTTATKHTDDDILELTAKQDGDFDLNFTGIDAGDYEFDFEVTDTTATATDSISVKDSGSGSVGVSDSEVDEGDVAEIVVSADNTDNGQIIIGDFDDVNYQLNATIDFEDADEVTLYFNTYKAGNNSDLSNVLWTDTDEDGAITNRQEQGDLDDAVLSPGAYELVAADTNDYADAIENPDNIATLFIEERSLDAINTWTASSDSVSDVLDEDVDDQPGAVSDAIDNGLVTSADAVAHEDYVVYQLEASGLEGLLENETNNGAANLGEAFKNVATESDDNDRLLDMRVRETQSSVGPNAQRDRINFENTDVDVVHDDENGQYFIILDTEEIELQNAGTGLEKDTDYEFDVRFQVRDQRLLGVDEDDLEDNELSDFYEAINTDFEIVERDGSFDLNDEDQIEVEADSGQEITGETNIAPGSEVQIRLRGSGDARFSKTVSEIVVDSDGTFAGEFDFSDRNVDDEFTSTLRQVVSSGTDNPEEDGIVVEQVVEPEDDEEAPEDDDSDADDGDADDGDADDGDADDSDADDGDADADEGDADDGDSDDGESEEETPGFGAIVALVAVLGAALLATRRQN